MIRLFIIAQVSALYTSLSEWTGHHRASLIMRISIEEMKIKVNKLFGGGGRLALLHSSCK